MMLCVCVFAVTLKLNFPAVFTSIQSLAVSVCRFEYPSNPTDDCRPV